MVWWREKGKSDQQEYILLVQFPAGKKRKDRLLTLWSINVELKGGREQQLSPLFNISLKEEKEKMAEKEKKRKQGSAPSSQEIAACSLLLQQESNACFLLSYVIITTYVHSAVTFRPINYSWPVLCTFLNAPK